MNGTDFGSHDGAAVNLTDALVTKANTEHRNAPSETTNRIHRHTGILGCSWPRRDHHRVGRGRRQLLDRDIVAQDNGLGPQRSEGLSQVVDERIEVVYEKKAHGVSVVQFAAGARRSTGRALFLVSGSAEP